MTENEKILDRLREYGIPVPHFSVYLTDVRYVVASGDWYIQDDAYNWYYLNGVKHGRHWTICPYGPIDF